MPLLDAPAFELRIETEDALGILEKILKERHWRNFEVANLSLTYIPYWFFNYDVYREVAGRTETFSSQMCLNALTGELEPLIVTVVDEIPLKKSKDITHGVSFETERPSIQKEEVKKIAGIKVSGEIGIPKDNVTISGVHLMYVPVYRIWVTLKSGIRRVDLDGMSGSSLNVEEVPERERGFLEVTKDTLEELKTPKGWVDYSQKAFNWGLGVTTGMTKKAGTSLGTSLGGLSGGLSGVLHWMVSTRVGRYSFLALIIVILLILIFFTS